MFAIYECVCVCVCVYIYIYIYIYIYRMRHLTLPILSWQNRLCGLWEGSLTKVVGFRVALDSVNDGTLVRAAAHILCGTVRVKHSPDDFSLGLVTFRGPPIHRTLLQQNFFMGVFESSSFYSHPH